MVLQMKSFAQSHFVGNSHEVLLVSLPIELNPQGFQGLVPGTMMDAFGVSQDAIEIEQQGVKPEVISRSYQDIIIS